MTNVTHFSVILKELNMGCKDTVLPKHLLKKNALKRLTFGEITQKPYNDNLGLFKALALHMHGIENLEEKT